MRLISTQNAEGSRQKGAPPLSAARCVLPTAYRPLPTSPRGFTLVEMLVVMGIIVLAIAMAVPTIRYLTGSKSEQAAQNAVAAMLARARTDAVGTQQPEGVLFLLDRVTDRVVMMQVMQTMQAGDPPGVTYLDLVPDRDPLSLPPGVRAWTINDLPLPGATDPFGATSTKPGYRYLGFNDLTYNTASTDKAMIGGVILFDGQGNLLVTQYGFRYLISSVATPLANALFSSPPTSGGFWPTSPSTQFLRSQLGLVLFDRDAFQNLQPSAPNKDGNNTGAEASVDSWLDQNTTMLLVNRYNGTLIRAE